MGFTIRGVIVLVLVTGARVAPAAPAEAPAPAELRLAELIAVAVRQSPALERARIDLDAARAALLQAEGLEDVRVGAEAFALAGRTTADDPNGEVEQRRVGLEVSARRALPSGGTLGVAAITDRTHLVGIQRDVNGNAVQSGVDRRYSASLVFELVQPLLRGAGQAAFEAPIRQAARQRDAAALTREARARDLVVSLAQAYWQVAFAWRQLEVREASLELAQQQLAYTEGAIRAEKVARSEALAVQQAIAIRKQDVIAGEQDLYERSVELRQLGGLEIGPAAIAVKTEALPATIAAGELDVAAVVRGAFEHSAELAALAAARHAAEIGVVAADSDARSKLDLGVTAGPVGAETTAGCPVVYLRRFRCSSASAAIFGPH
jgi:HAE1 family hydrophobic/amphiphilic exporter-1